MRKQTPSLDWQIIDDDAEWERQQTLFEPEKTPPPNVVRLLQTYSWILITLLLLLVMAGHWWWRTTRTQARQAQLAATVSAQQALMARGTDLTSLAATVERRSQGRAPYPYAVTGGATNSSNPSAKIEESLDADFQLAELHGDQAVVSVSLADHNGGPVYQQTRFYQRTTTGWQRTAPDATLWGPQQSLETPYFLYRFRQRDAATVRAIAAQMDALYTTFRDNFGLPVNHKAAKFVIHVRVDPSLPKGLPEFDEQQQIYVRSPALYLAPLTLREEELLAQSILLPLLKEVVTQAGAHHGVNATWRSFLDGLYLWQVWDVQLPLARWRDEVVRWQYLDIPLTQPGEAITLPKHYQELCADHNLWMWSPMQIDVPLVCIEGDWEHWHWSEWKTSKPLTHLRQLYLPSSPVLDRWDTLGLAPPLHANHPGRKVALATLIAYAADTYGRERLPVLVAGLGQHPSWDTLIPAVFGVSADEFEGGWQAYLAAHYDVPIARR